MLQRLQALVLTMLLSQAAFAQGATIDIGGFSLAAGQSASYFWDVPRGTQEYCNWIVTPVPFVLAPNLPEQRVEVTKVFMLRKGVGSTDPGQLQINYTFHNIGAHPAHGRVIISSLCPR